MPETTFMYPFDPTGLKASNRIEGELQVLSPPAWRDYHFVIPMLAPFFRDGFQIRHLDTNRDLIEGVDFLFTHRFWSASQAIMKPIHGSVLFLDKTLDGAVEMTYQTLGGEWTIDGAQVTQLLSQKQVNPRITTWEQVAAVPQQFPVIDHQWHLTDMVGMAEVRTELENLATAMETAGVPNSEFTVHQNNLSNPHQVTKDQIGLGSVVNIPPATRAQAINGTHEESVMTPRRTYQAFEAYIQSLVDRIDAFETTVNQRLDQLEADVQTLNGP